MPRVTDPQDQIDSLTADVDRLYAENQRLKMLLYNAKVGANKWCLKYNEAKWARIKASDTARKINEEKYHLVSVINWQRKFLIILLSRATPVKEVIREGRSCLE